MSLFVQGTLVCLCLLLSACGSRNLSQETQYNPKPSNSRRPTTVWIDAGHGGQDSGAVNKRLRLQEKHLCLKTAQLVQKKLLAMGYHAKLLRSKDEYISLDKRVSLANSERKSVMVSIHFNSAKNIRADGVEVFYYAPARAISPLHNLSKELSKSIEKKIIFHTKANSRGVKIGSFRVIRSTEMPSCLVEGGFLTNAKEAKKLSQISYLDSLASGIAEGIHQFCSQHSLSIHKL